MNGEEEKKPLRHAAGFSLHRSPNNAEIPVITLDSSDSADTGTRKKKVSILDSESDDDENDFQPALNSGRSSQYRNTAASRKVQLRKSRSSDSFDSDNSDEAVNEKKDDTKGKKNISGAGRRTSVQQHQQKRRKVTTPKPLKPADKALQLAMLQQQASPPAPPRPAPARKRAAPRRPTATNKKDMVGSRQGSCANANTSSSPTLPSPPPKKSRFSDPLPSGNGPDISTDAPPTPNLLKSRIADVPLEQSRPRPPMRSSPGHVPAAAPKSPQPQPSAPSTKIVCKEKTQLINLSKPTKDEIAYDRLQYFLVRPKANPHTSLSIPNLAEFSPFAHAASLIEGCTSDSVCAVCGSGEEISFQCQKCRLSFHAGCLNPPVKHKDDTVKHCGACRPIPKSESIAIPPTDTAGADSRANSSRAGIGLGKVIRQLASDAAKGNPTAFILHPALQKQFVKSYKMDWLRCSKCKRLREITEGVLTECVQVPFECKDAYWMEEDKDKVCAKPTTEKEIKAHGDLEQQISERSRRRVRLMYSHLGEVNRDLFGFPKFGDVINIDSTDEDETTTGATGKERESSTPARTTGTNGNNNSINRAMLGALEKALGGNNNSNAANEITPSVPNVPPPQPSGNITESGIVTPAFAATTTPRPTKSAAAIAAAFEEAARAAAGEVAQGTPRFPPTANPQSRAPALANAPISASEMTSIVPPKPTGNATSTLKNGTISFIDTTKTTIHFTTISAWYAGTCTATTATLQWKSTASN